MIYGCGCRTTPVPIIVAECLLFIAGQGNKILTLFVARRWTHPSLDQMSHLPPTISILKQPTYDTEF